PTGLDHLPRASSLLRFLLRPLGPPLFPYATLFRSCCQISLMDDAHDRAMSADARRRKRWVSARERPGIADAVDVCTHTFVHQYRSEEHTSELQSRENLVCRLLLVKENIASSYHPSI